MVTYCAPAQSTNWPAAHMAFLLNVTLLKLQLKAAGYRAFSTVTLRAYC